MQALINQVQFSPDGRMIASGSFDKSVKLWDGVTGKYITSLRGHVRWVLAHNMLLKIQTKCCKTCVKGVQLKLWLFRVLKCLEGMLYVWIAFRSTKVVQDGDYFYFGNRDGKKGGCFRRWGWQIFR